MLRQTSLGGSSTTIYFFQYFFSLLFSLEVYIEVIHIFGYLSLYDPDILDFIVIINYFSLRIFELPLGWINQFININFFKKG